MADKHYYAIETAITLLTGSWIRRRIPRARVVMRFDSKEARDGWIKDDPAVRARRLESSGEVQEAKKMIRMGFTWPIHFW